MKKLFVMVMMLVLSSFVFGATEVQVYQKIFPWELSSDVIIRAHTLLDPATGLSAASVAALDTNDTISIELADGTFGVDFRFRVKSGHENDVDVIEHYVRATSSDGADHWIHVATHTITLGTQVYSADTNFVDTIVDTNDVWYHSLDPVCPANSIAFDSFETFGFRYHLFICTSLCTGNIIYIDYRRW
jgi:hypothetical protein